MHNLERHVCSCSQANIYLVLFSIKGEHREGKQGHLMCAWDACPAATVVPFLQSAVLLATTACQTVCASFDLSYLHTMRRVVVISFGFLTVQCL